MQVNDPINDKTINIKTIKNNYFPNWTFLTSFEVKMQLTVEQRFFVVSTYLETKSYNAVREAFVQIFPGRNAPCKKTVYKNIQKYKENGTSLNLNKSRSGRRRSVRTAENIGLVRNALIENPKISTRRNSVPVSRRTSKESSKRI